MVDDAEAEKERAEKERSDRHRRSLIEAANKPMPGQSEVEKMFEEFMEELSMKEEVI